MKILVVGSGTAGLISALILKQHVNADIDVVSSKNIGIVGVGEGSTEHFDEFIKFVGIDQYSIIKKCDATYKAGIMFDGWSKEKYLHSVSYPFDDVVAQYPYVYSYLISNNSNYLNPESIWQNKINKWFINKNNEKPFYQYHFNSFKLNDFLIDVCKQRNIKFFEDEIEKIIFKENGEINSLIGKKEKYSYDFYIDSTGFKKLLISKMGSEWISFKKYLKMKSAIVFSTDDEKEYNLWTLSKAMDYGWRFKIPVWGRHGNGYIYDSDYITADKAKEEIDKEFGYDIEISKEFKFDPGHINTPWIKNCVAIGLSSNFVEPLEATSIGTSIQQSFMLMHKILNYSEKDISIYNKNFSEIMNNIRDFIFLHYMTKKDNTNFWKDVKNIEVPETLSEKLNLWKNRLPIREDFYNSSNYILFYQSNFINVMHGTNLFDYEKIKNYYENHSDWIKILAKEKINEKIYFDKNSQYIGHKEFISIVRNYM